MREFDVAKLRKLDGGLLLVFNELMHCRNAREAATRLHLSPSAISHALTRLRDLFEDPLFLRRSHGLEPTVQAFALHVRTKKVLEAADRLLGTEHAFDPATSRRQFNIGAPEYAAALLAAPMVKRWKRRAPSLFVRFQVRPPVTAMDGLRRGNLDLAVGRFEDPMPNDLVRTPLYDDVYCVVARRDHPRVKTRISRSAFDGERHVLASAASEVTVSESLVFPAMPSGVIVDNWLMALTMVAETDLLATCHRRMAGRYARRLRLRLVEPPFVPDVFTVSALHRKDPDPGVRWLMTEVREIVGRDPPTAPGAGAGSRINAGTAR